MKTFKLISLRFIGEKDVVDILLEDGLIINKEEENKTWLIEVFVTDTYLNFFQKALEEDQELIVEAIITGADNAPVSFLMRIKSVRKLDARITVLLEGTLKKARSSSPEQTLEGLIKEGLSGEQLLNEFQKRRNRQTSSTTKVEDEK